MKLQLNECDPTRRRYYGFSFLAYAILKFWSLFCSSILKIFALIIKLSLAQKKKNVNHGLDVL